MTKEMAGVLDDECTVLCDRHPAILPMVTGPAKLFYIGVTTESPVLPKCLHDLGEVNMAHPATLRDFIVYCQEKHPASIQC